MAPRLFSGNISRAAPAPPFLPPRARPPRADPGFLAREAHTQKTRAFFSIGPRGYSSITGVCVKGEDNDITMAKGLSKAAPLSVSRLISSQKILSPFCRKLRDFQNKQISQGPNVPLARLLSYPSKAWTYINLNLKNLSVARKQISPPDERINVH